ncbi:hypothetical protein SAMN05660909_03745 [Chitinophaga terrae (ex Kim and Jung 2007)]|uniref:DUF4397 domain-containing protein n=1 Tax=Chitinophaga terrae (ex Kim and Jung 2007) TaxID=408074 RepID=A0A1H4EHC3_9BACT|nr:DUF4397 domain-containing protein [Chitinophaga terrae (ex Kim and Jung 2007)]GEP91656.1 hypothetical protein CTE07_33010 [Chitinophaga terrae (ex Kim and Jung 2007)]SEA84481.1 hypothetical protein SAMN05660909_03745 [Chitinophaga terrae (ex Kim and Jung 2007)]
MYYKRFAAALLLFAGCILSCKKEKLNYSYDNRHDTIVGGSSNVRLVNLLGNNQLAINGERLTGYLVLQPPVGGGEPLYPGTYWFPANGKMGTTFTIPRQFLTNGKAMVSSDNMAFQSPSDSIGFEITEEYNKPKDYYMVRSLPYTAAATERVTAIPRDITAPAKAGYFKIRLVNMGDEVAASNNAENLALPLTLAYADGTPVSNATSNINTHSWSDYVELPYGTYQFKVLTPSGTEVSSVSGNGVEQTNIIEPATSTLVKPVNGFPNAVSTGLTFGPVKTFQPGGVYTIAVGVTRMTAPYVYGTPGESFPFYQNTFRIIADISEPANTDYYRLQAVQANPDEAQVTFRVNGEKLGDAGYAAHTGYGIYITGETTIEALDAAGKVIASAKQLLKPGLNYTAWLYLTPEGKAAISLVNNNLSGGWYAVRPDNTGQDGIYNRMLNEYPFNLRFLNFCPDLPYVSFTMDNGQAVGSETGSRNLQPGIPALELPYARFNQVQEAYRILAYRSGPGVYPGTWLSEIPVLKSTDLIARPDAYVRPVKPVHEPGIYTIALIGRLKGNLPEATKAKMIIIKHTK